MLNKNKIFFGLTILLPVLYGIFAVQNFSTPLSTVEGGDAEEWEYVGYFLSENLSFKPFPQLSFLHNQTFYPIGTKQVFLDWSLESNYWFAFFYKSLGFGAWLNYYYVLSLIISFAGSYWVLKNDFGKNKAFFIGFLVVFYNFYALFKHPVHFPHSTLHWTILSIFTDFILLKRIYFYEKLSLKWVFLKVFLLFAVLGLNIGYIAGYALSSFTLSFFVFIALIIFDWKNRKRQALGYFQDWKNEFSSQKWFFSLLFLPIFIVIYFIFPLVLQIYLEAKSTTVDSSHLSSYWVHPLRLLFPYFPNFNAIYVPFTHILNDMPEGESAGSVGWFVLSLGVLGFFQQVRKNWVIFLPISILFVLAILYHPNRVPTLKIFPWFEFNRVGSRFTSIIPVIFCCYFLLFKANFHAISSKMLIIFLSIIFIAESYSLAKFLSNRKVFYFEKVFFDYMKTVEKQEGEAVLDFPFCIVGGDGAGLKENLCPIFKHTSGIYAYRRFHHKKVVGGYYSHIPPGELHWFEKSGLGKLAYGNGDWQTSSKITNDFTDEQLRYFIEFFKVNDFCGINLYKNLISEKLFEKIVVACGSPIAKTTITGAGEVFFIPKNQNWNKFEDKTKALQMKFPCNCE